MRFRPSFTTSADGGAQPHRVFAPPFATPSSPCFLVSFFLSCRFNSFSFFRVALDPSLRMGGDRLRICPCPLSRLRAEFRFVFLIVALLCDLPLRSIPLAVCNAFVVSAGLAPRLQSVFALARATECRNRLFGFASTTNFRRVIGLAAGLAPTAQSVFTLSPTELRNRLFDSTFRAYFMGSHHYRRVRGEVVRAPRRTAIRVALALYSMALTPE
jgi:hypothetical protein